MNLEFHHEGHLGGYVIGQPDPASWYPWMWKWLTESCGIESVIDLGCGEGYTTKFFLDLGLEAIGVEGCSKAVVDTVAPGFVDLHDFVSGPYCNRSVRWDLAWCCEVVEHIEEQYLDNLLLTIKNANCKWVAMTHALPGQGGHHHVNCQPKEYWVDQLSSIGYNVDEDITKKAKMLAGFEVKSYPNHFTKSGLIFHAE